MKPHIETHIGTTPDAKKYSVALFVLDLDNLRIAQELKPVLKKLVEAKVSEHLRQGLPPMGDGQGDKPELH